MRFLSRQDAGQKLGRHLVNEGVDADIVLGLPRGGVIVAAEVAHALQCPLDVLVVRKIGHPLHREFAVGAMAENDVVLLNEKVIAPSDAIRAGLNEVIAEEKDRFLEYQEKFHMDQPPDLSGQDVLIVDDGLATGSTMEVAVLSARKRGAASVSVAVPVASRSAAARLGRIARAVYAEIVDPGFEAVGAYYEAFSQTDDVEVLDLLRAEHAHH